MTTITVDYLREQDACPEQVELFAETFGQSAELTRENLIKAAQAGLDTGWLAKCLLDEDAELRFYRSLYPALCHYNAIVGAAHQRHEKIVSALSGAQRYRFERAAYAAFDAVRNAQRRAYDLTVAQTLAGMLELP